MLPKPRGNNAADAFENSQEGGPAGDLRGTRINPDTGEEYDEPCDTFTCSWFQFDLPGWTDTGDYFIPPRMSSCTIEVWVHVHVFYWSVTEKEFWDEMKNEGKDQNDKTKCTPKVITSTSLLEISDAEPTLTEKMLLQANGQSDADAMAVNMGGDQSGPPLATTGLTVTINSDPDAVVTVTDAEKGPSAPASTVVVSMLSLFVTVLALLVL